MKSEISQIRNFAWHWPTLLCSRQPRKIHVFQLATRPSSPPALRLVLSLCDVRCATLNKFSWELPKPTRSLLPNHRHRAAIMPAWAWEQMEISVRKPRTVIDTVVVGIRTNWMMSPSGAFDLESPLGCWNQWIIISVATSDVLTSGLMFWEKFLMSVVFATNQMLTELLFFSQIFYTFGMTLT